MATTKTETTTEEAARDAAKQIAELEKAIVDRVSTGIDTMTKAIKDHPIAAVGIGFAAGYVLARLLSRD